MAKTTHIRNGGTEKLCPKCLKWLPATTEAYNRLHGGLQARCRKCQRADAKAHYQTPAAQAALKVRQEANKDARRAYISEWQKNNRARIAEAECKRRESPEYLEKMRLYQAEFQRKRRRNNPAAKEYLRAYSKRPYVKVRARERHLAYVKRRLQEDGEFALRYKTRRDFTRAMKAFPREFIKGWWWEKVCGYTVEDLRSHLEAQFLEGMAWDNHGTVWEIDHIKPLAAFVIPNESCPAFKEAWALSNLRPLEKRLNNAKGARLSAAQ